MIELKPHYGAFPGRERIAPIMRNTDIVNAAHRMIAFPVGPSPGTRDSIRKAVQKYGAQYVIVVE